MEPHDSVQVQPLLWSKNQGRGVQTCSLDGWQSSPAWRLVMAKHSLTVFGLAVPLAAPPDLAAQQQLQQEVGLSARASHSLSCAQPHY